MENNGIDIQVYLNTLRQKGHLAYEYHPFRNYQTEEDLYLVKDKFLVPDKCAVDLDNGEILTTKQDRKWINKFGKVVENYKEYSDGELYARKGSLLDLDTDKLNFDLNHPVELEIQPSYDGSVNVILNDDKNIPRLINSRFSAREKNTYEIVDRIGENNTNIYNSKTFDKDTSLYFQYNQNPVISFSDYVDGILPVGQYCFYFTYCDADDNESDIIAETGVIPAFIGDNGNPFSMDGGIKNQLSKKGIRLQLSNIDKSYNYLKIYYVRYFADYQQNRVYECKKIYQKYAITSTLMFLQITGNERTEDLDANILNISKFNPKSVLTQAQCKNMLFFGNIVKNTDNYKELTDCALRIVPSLYKEEIKRVSADYSKNTGYYDSNLTYTKTGYFPQEYYRFGVVFIYQNGTLSNVYNTLGYTLNDSPEQNIKCSIDLFKQDEAYYNRQYIDIDDEGYINNYCDDQKERFNARGVCKIDVNPEFNEILGIKFTIPKEVTDFLKDDLGIRGLFFVRQKCVPTILAQCYLLPMDEEMHAPVLHVFNKVKTGEQEDIEEVYVSESFLDQKNKNSSTPTGEDGDYPTRDLTQSYDNRLHSYINESCISRYAYAAICPDFLLNQPYYNQIFNGSNFLLKGIYNFKLERKEASSRFYINQEPSSSSSDSYKKVTICSVTEDVPSVAIRDQIYKLEMGVTEEAYKFVFTGDATVDDSYKITNNTEYREGSNNTNLIRGKYSPYLAIYSLFSLQTNKLYNIYKEGAENTEQEYKNRMDSYEPFYAISDRYNFNQLNKTDEGYYQQICYRGDCFINQFTYRLNRNFNDPSLPNNDIIIDKNTWKNHYGEGKDITEWAKISRSDVNAVQLGSWITFPLRSAMNYAYRSVDHSYVSEEALMGAPRSFYPRSSLLWRGSNKMPDSYLYNDAYRATLGFKCYFTLQDINYIKDTFSNRIQYSAIAIQDSFKNNYRESLSTYYRDYSQEYGSIQKLIGFEGYLLVVFEHAIGIAVINERVLAGTGDGEPVFINSRNVLPEELTVISDTYGTQWGDSVVKSEAGYVYGVDTIAKKIWRVRGQNIEILSDFKVNNFLINNISLGERETTPIIGLKNVKSHYNNNKKDIIFTFYDDIYKDEEKVWSLCYNELLDQFVTFYSWIPSFSENIDTQFFTFNRDTAKYLSLLNKCNYHKEENSGILLDTPIIINDDEDKTFNSIKVYYKDKVNYTLKQYGNTEKINYDIKYTQKPLKIEHDHWGAWKWFDFPLFNGIWFIGTDGNENPLEDVTARKDDFISRFNQDEKNKIAITRIVEGSTIKYFCEFLDSDIPKNHQVIQNYSTNLEIHQQYKLIAKDYEEIRKWFRDHPVLYLEVTAYDGTEKNPINEKTETIVLTTEEIVNNPMLEEKDYNKLNLSTDFYLHGNSGIIDIKEDLYPTHWYGKTHPFEFEFVVNDKIAQQKIFNNLVLISNKAEPESFHFEIEGDNYEFSSDKRNMYFRQEATKQLYQNLGSNILYNRFFTDVKATNYTKEQYYRKKSSDYTDKYNKMDKVYPIGSSGLTQQVKSTIFPLYYERIDTFDDIYHNYQLMKDDMYDFQNLSGSEVAWNRKSNQFNIITHIKNNPIDKVGRLRGNSRYKEGSWNIQIPSINFMQKNENPWPYGQNQNYQVPPIIINSQYVPKDLTDNRISADKLPNTYTRLDRENGEDSEKEPLVITDYIDTKDWTYRKEAKIRDKWMKVRVRYSGENLAVIHSLITLYDISYA